MTIQLFERTAVRNRLNRIMQDTDLDREHPLPLRTELFLIAHDDDTGQCHVDRTRLERVLAAAVPLDLLRAARVDVGVRFDPRGGRVVREPERVAALGREPVGDPVTDSALRMLWRNGGTMTVREFIGRLTDTGMYERVRADLIASGMVHRVTYRKWGLFRRERYKVIHKSYAVRIRTRIRELADTYWQDRERGRYPQSRIAGLAVLVTLVGLARRLFPQDVSTNHVRHRLAQITEQYPDPAVRDVVAAFNRRNR
ncbi:MAG TPA: GPP34 family phosphoprotein [Micromonosporaceae bacterium]